MASSSAPDAQMIPYKRRRPPLPSPARPPRPKTLIPYKRRRPLLPSPSPWEPKPLVTFDHRPCLLPPPPVPAPLLLQDISAQPSQAVQEATQKTRATLDLSFCFSCRRNFPISRRKSSLLVLRSLWRVVLLCEDCYAHVRSAEFCSYCFLSVTVDGTSVSCCRCSRRVHIHCVPCEHRCTSIAKIDGQNFVCVDCCPIPCMFGRQNEHLNWWLPTDQISKEAKKKAEQASMLKGIAQNKVLMAKQATNRAKELLDTLLVQKENNTRQVDRGVLPDDKLALQLHLEMNGSRRILRSQNKLGKSDAVFGKNTGMICVENKAVVDVFETSAGSIDSTSALGCFSDGLLECYGNADSHSEEFCVDEIGGSVQHPVESTDVNNENTTVVGCLSEGNLQNGRYSSHTAEVHAEDIVVSEGDVCAVSEGDALGSDVAQMAFSNLQEQNASGRLLKVYSRRSSKYAKRYSRRNAERKNAIEGNSEVQ